MADGFAYPIFLDLREKNVLIIGGGNVGTRKAKSLLDAGANVTVISPTFSAELSALAPIKKITSAYDSKHLHLEKWTLIFAATTVRAINAQIALDAGNENILCCRCDIAQEGDFISAAVERVGGVTLAISTGGASPVLAQRVSASAAGAIDPVLAALVGHLQKWRPLVMAAQLNPPERTGLFLRLAGAEMETALRSHGPAAAEALFEQWLAEARAGVSHVD
jgi:precorrin-2 dehydrogenase/sirohydrochlorin ferrochelatase